MKMNKTPCVYILASNLNGTLYIGVTSDLKKRVWQHKNNVIDGFTKDHNIHTLVYYELHQRMEDAILREKQIKKWQRNWKKKIIAKMNPKWEDLYKII